MPGPGRDTQLIPPRRCPWAGIQPQRHNGHNAKTGVSPRVGSFAGGFIPRDSGIGRRHPPLRSLAGNCPLW